MVISERSRKGEKIIRKKSSMLDNLFPFVIIVSVEPLITLNDAINS